MEADFIAASFTRRADDVLQIRQELEKNSNHSIRIIAKIENAEGVDNIDDILRGVGRHHGRPGRHGRGDRPGGNPQSSRRS